MKKISLYFFVSWLIILGGCKEDSLQVVSPSGENNIMLHLDSSGALFYTIHSHDVAVVENSRLGFSIAGDGAGFDKGLKFVKVIKTNIDQSYHLPTGKKSTYTNKCVQKTFIFKNRESEDLRLVCRAYDDGVAFRYVLKKPGKITVTDEHTTFNIPPNTMSWMMNFVPSYENFYPERKLDTIAVKPLSYPALMHIHHKIWMLLTEASVYDQPATHLVKTGSGNTLTVALPQQECSVDSVWRSPWRAFILGDKLGTIVESTMAENLNPPSAVKDTGWITSGVAVFPWWGNYLANSYIDTLKAYVDMAAEMGWKWIEFDVSLVGSPWHTSRQWETTKWLPEFTAYARSKGVNVYGWDEMKILHSPGGRAYVFGRYRELGIKGIKIDYMNSDKADAVRFRDSALADAAKYHLLVSFHGASAPRGMRRKWPNMMTEEAVRGAEYYTFKDAAPPTPVHNCTLPFTRNVIGPMDYTPATFTIRPENPRITTYAHELALPFIFESGWTCMADRPAMYLSSPAKAMLKRIKTSWDDIHFIDGYPGKFICLARRKGDDWYLAAINAGAPRTVRIPLAFLKKGHYKIKVYEDDLEKPLTNIKIQEMEINSSDTLRLPLAENGGVCTVIDQAY